MDEVGRALSRCGLAASVNDVQALMVRCGGDESGDEKSLDLAGFTRLVELLRERGLEAVREEDSCEVLAVPVELEAGQDGDGDGGDGDD